ncbi:MAG: MoxR family ATPase, partial [Phycisphaerales bacterium]|nr:MoxR family ATPase [Phycisphaerales bacterium]
TYPLPEAQLDRFLFNIKITYPTEAQELQIVQQTTSVEDMQVNAVLSGEDVVHIQNIVRQVPVADHVVRYALRLTRATRVREETEKPEIVRNYLSWGAGPRASQSLIIAAKARAILAGSSHVMPEHVQAVALPVMRHRIITNFNAEADGVTTDDIITTLLEQTPIDASDASTGKRMDTVMH